AGLRAFLRGAVAGGDRLVERGDGGVVRVLEGEDDALGVARAAVVAAVLRNGAERLLRAVRVFLAEVELSVEVAGVAPELRGDVARLDAVEDLEEAAVIAQLVRK